MSVHQLGDYYVTLTRNQSINYRGRWSEHCCREEIMWRLVIIGERKARDRDQIDVLCNTIIVERDYRCFLNKINGQFRYFL